MAEIIIQTTGVPFEEIDIKKELRDYIETHFISGKLPPPGVNSYGQIDAITSVRDAIKQIGLELYGICSKFCYVESQIRNPKEPIIQALISLYSHPEIHPADFKGYAWDFNDPDSIHLDEIILEHRKTTAIPFNMDFIEDRLIDIIKAMEKGRIWQQGVNFSGQYLKFTTMVQITLLMIETIHKMGYI